MGLVLADFQLRCQSGHGWSVPGTDVRIIPRGNDTLPLDAPEREHVPVPRTVNPVCPVPLTVRGTRRRRRGDRARRSSTSLMSSGRDKPWSQVWIALRPAPRTPNLTSLVSSSLRTILDLRPQASAHCGQLIEIVLIRQGCSPRAYSRAKSSGRVPDGAARRVRRNFLRGKTRFFVGEVDKRVFL